MGNSIDRTQIIQFSDMVHAKSQQIRARLRPHVIVKPMTGDVMAYDGLGDAEATEVNGRAQKIVLGDIEHNRRKISRRRFVLNLPIDGHDVAGALLNPQGLYSEAVIRAMERVFDRVVIQAMFADVLTGRDFESTVTYSSEGYTPVDATAGLTYDKLLEIGQNFTDNEVGNDIPEKFVLGISGKENTSLMGETELTSGDFSRQFAVEKGELVKAGPFEIVKYGASVNNPMLPVSGGERACFAMSTRAICVGISKEFQIEIKDLPEYVDTKIVQIIGTLGAVRTEGKLIQKVRTTA